MLPLLYYYLYITENNLSQSLKIHGTKVSLVFIIARAHVVDVMQVMQFKPSYIYSTFNSVI